MSGETARHALAHLSLCQKMTSSLFCEEIRIADLAWGASVYSEQKRGSAIIMICNVAVVPEFGNGGCSNREGSLRPCCLQMHWQGSTYRTSHARVPEAQGRLADQRNQA